MSADSTDRVLDAAEELFLRHGYAGTRLRDIAGALGVKHASLYHHAPGGKSELWERVLTRAAARHREGLAVAAEEAGPALRDRLLAMAMWLLSQPPVNAASMAITSLAGSTPEETQATAAHLQMGLMDPVTDTFALAAGRGELRDVDPAFLAGMFLACVNGVSPLLRAGMAPIPPEMMFGQMIDVLLTGACRPADG